MPRESSVQQDLFTGGLRQVLGGKFNSRIEFYNLKKDPHHHSPEIYRLCFLDKRPLATLLAQVYFHQIEKCSMFNLVDMGGALAGAVAPVQESMSVQPAEDAGEAGSVVPAADAGCRSALLEPNLPDLHAFASHVNGAEPASDEAQRAGILF